MGNNPLTQQEQERAVHLYFAQNQSLQMIANSMGRSLCAIYCWVKKAGKPRSVSEGNKLAHKMGRGNKAGKANPLWRGGRCIDGWGYIRLWTPSSSPFYCMADSRGYIAEHRLVMAEYLGRPLNKDEVVHHLNGIKSDNRKQNLALVTQSNHPSKTLMKHLQKRIRDLEAQLFQQRFNY